MTLPELSEKMRDIDFAMLMTRAPSGDIAGRPMSNNREVDYDGDSYYFAYENTHTVSDIQRDAKVGLSFQGNKGLLGKPPMFISVEGQGEIVRDKQQFAQHWSPDLERWFPQGIDTAGLVMIKVRASRIHYWSGQDDGEIVL